MNGPIFQSLVVFMLPILVSCLFQQLYNTVDTMIVGNVLGDTALAAIGACGAIYELLVGFGIGIGNGLAIVAARAYGAGDEEQLKQTVAGSIVIGLIASAVITLAGATGLRPLLELLDTPAEIFEDAYRYIIIIDFGVIVMFAYNLCAGLLRAIGNSFMPLVFLILSSVLNVILDLWFIAVLGMGVAGAGVATVISQGVSVALCILYVFRSARLLLPGRKALPCGEPPLLGAVQPEHLHGPHEQHRLGGLRRFAVRHQRPRYAGHRGPHRGPKALRFYGYAPVGDGLCLLDLRLPELRREPSRPRPPRNAGHLSLQCRGGCDAAILLMSAGCAGEPEWMVKKVLVSGSSEPVVLENGARYLIWNAPFYAVLGMLLSTRYALQSMLAALLGRLEDDVLIQGLNGVDVDDRAWMPSAASCSAAMRASLTIRPVATMAMSSPSVICSPLPSSKW